MKQELNMKYYQKFCSCCGRKSEKIWNMLLKQIPNEKRQRKWKGHTLYPPTSICGKNNIFYDGNVCEFCEKCGNKMHDEEFKIVIESRGEFWGAPCSEQVLTGYECGNCGYKVKF